MKRRATQAEAQERYKESEVVTAGELRGFGVHVPSDVPNHAWIPKHAIKVNADESWFPDDGTFLNVQGAITITGSFRWIETSK